MPSIRRQQGFTLVEMAIVLVIIGLLLGGILKGQELITSARVRNIADQNSGVQAAYYGFIDRYRQVPGDWGQINAAKAIPGVGSGGNASGRLDGDGFGEALALWEQLSKSGFIQGHYTGGTTAPNQDDVNLAPRNAFNGFLMLFSSSDYKDVSGNTPSEKLNLVLGTGIPVNVIAELDRKIDDGLPLTGVVRQAVTSGGHFDDISHSKTACVESADSVETWDIETNEQNCNGVYLY